MSIPAKANSPSCVRCNTRVRDPANAYPGTRPREEHLKDPAELFRLAPRGHRLPTNPLIDLGTQAR